MMENIQIIEHIDSLPWMDRFLITEAMIVARDAYAPYSGLKVGAALRLDNDVIVKGSNQENASFPVGICAERTAIFWAGANFPRITPHTLAIVCLKDGNPLPKPITPCGLCRQALLEYELRFNASLRIILTNGKSKTMILPSAKSLLPLGFTADEWHKTFNKPH